MHDMSFYQQLFEASPHPYMILGADDRFTIMAVNERYLQVTNRQRAAMIGRGLFEVFPNDPNDLQSTSVSDLSASLYRVISSKQTDVMSVQQYDIPAMDGSAEFVRRYWSPVNTPVLNAQGNLICIMHYAEDVTEFILSREHANQGGQDKQARLHTVSARAERIQAEIMHRTAEVKTANRALKQDMQELSRLNVHLTELDQLKSKFFANISHELRTPLTLILAPLEKRLQQISGDDRAVAERREVELMLRNARLIYRHVTDLLEVAKLEAGRIKPHWARFDLARLVRTTASHFESLVSERQIVYEVSADTTLMIESDSERLQRVLLNLLSNAFKFTPRGGHIAVRLVPGGDQAQLVVQDDGPGIPAEWRGQIFEPFVQVEGANQHDQKGTGLGLAIVKEFVELLGGHIELRESLGGGALFVIDLPLKAPAGTVLLDTPSALDAVLLHETIDELKPQAAAAVKPAVPATDTQPRVLVVEDNADLNRFICEVLQPHYHVVSARDGWQGLEQALAVTPDLILTDIMMPHMSGDEMVRHIRQQAALSDVPIVVMTAKTDDAQRIELLRNSVQDYLNKPFVVPELLLRVDRLIAQRQRIREQLLESEARFQATFEQAAVGIAIKSPEGHWMRVNRKLCEIVGYTAAELTGLNFKNLTHPDDLEIELERVREILAGTRTTYTLEKRYCRKDGSWVWINLTASLVRKVDHTPNYFIVIIEDIQDRKEIEAEFKEAKRIANLGHWKWDLRSNDYTWSEEVYRIFGRDLQFPTANYEEAQQYYAPASREHLAAAVKNCLTQGVTLQFDAECIRPDGECRWVTVRGEAVRDAAEHIVGLHGTIQDITERKRAEMALQESREQLKLFIEYAPASLAMFDREMRYLALSQRWRGDYQLGDEEVLGLCHYAIFPEIGGVWKDIHRRGLAGEIIRAEEDLFERSDGSSCWLRWEVRPWYQAGGSVGGIVIFTEDITVQKEAEVAMRQFNATLERRIAERTAELSALNQSLESFVYSVSHDLKAPLRGVEGYSRLLQEDYGGQLDEEGRLFVQNIRSGVARMNELITDLLTYSRMERRKLEPATLDLTALVDQVLQTCAQEIAAQQIEVKNQLPALSVHGDREGILLVLRNLLENAIKFSKHAVHPRIELGASHDDQSVTLWVQDNGIGFDMKYNQRIFEIFERLHRQEDYPGTGIGLALVRKAMERMGGTVWAQSTPGQGATFFLRLPTVSPIQN